MKQEQWTIWPSKYPGIEDKNWNESIIVSGEAEEYCGIRGDTQEIRDQRARLISKAPEMYDLLKRIQDCWEDNLEEPMSLQDKVSKLMDSIDNPQTPKP